MKRRCLSFLLALCMLLTFLPASALADENSAADTDAAPPEISDASATQESAENSDLASEIAFPPDDADAVAVETADADAEKASVKGPILAPTGESSSINTDDEDFAELMGSAYIQPVSPWKITRSFSAHSSQGLDIGVPVGTAVYATAAGTVVTATDRGCQGSHRSSNAYPCPLGTNCAAYQASPSSNGSYANWIIINHGNNIYSLYAHLQTGSLRVKVGDHVEQGQQIANSGVAGNTTGPHLHLEFRLGNSYTNQVNPENYINGSAPNPDPVPNPKATLDINGLLNGNIVGWITDYGTFDIQVGDRFLDDVSDFCEQVPVGTAYKITDIKATDGHVYQGADKALEGTVNDTTEIALKFDTLYGLDVNGLLDGNITGWVTGYGTFDIQVGDRFLDDVTDFCEWLPCGTAYKITDVKALSGRIYQGSEGSLEGVLNATTAIVLKFDTDSYLINPIVYNADYYRSKHEDLQNAFGNDDQALLNHWIDCGIKEGRQASPAFSAQWYMKNHKDVAEALGADNYTGAIYHFFEHGAGEERQTSEEFSVKIYRTNYKDLREAFQSDIYAYFLHYINYGKAEGRIGNKRLDEEPPKITDANLTNVSANKCTLTVTATDNIGVDHVNFHAFYGKWTAAGETVYHAVKSGNNWSYDVPLTLSNGQDWSVDARIYDAAGNQALAKDGYPFVVVKLRDCAVTFDANGGSCGTSGKSVISASYGIKDEIKPRTYVTSYGDLPTPTRNGYNFDGWHTAASGGNKVTKDTKVTATADHTLYAHWTAIPKATYAITYVSNGGSGTMPKGAATEGIPFTLPACGFTKPSGKEFKAWSIDGKEYAPGASYTFTGNATVTAVWQANISVNPDEAQILIENQTVSFGSTFTVPVLLKNNPGVIGFSFAVEYDAEKLEYVSAADADFTGIAANVNADGNQLGFAFSSASKTNLVGEKIVNLTFRVKSGATGSASLSFILDETFGDGFSAFNSDTQKNEPVSVSIKNGEISIADFIPGDVDGSGRVDNEDLILLTRYRARWKVSINMDAADVDGSGKVDNEDLILLTRYRARWKVTLLPGKVSSGGSATLKSSPPEKVGGQIALTSETANVNPDSEFDVEVLLKDNPGVIGFSFAVEYDAEKLEYLGATDGDFNGVAENIGANDGQLGFAYSSASETNNTGAVIARLKFKARDGANGKAELSIVIDEDFGDGFSAFNPETQINESIAFTPVGIGITVNGTQDALYTVTVEDGSGSGEYKAGDAVSIVADSLPDGVAFDKWTGADNLQFISGNQNSATATFVMPNYDVTLSPSYRINAQGCYVATAVYGSYDCPEVWTLRRFRDDVLAKTWYGRLFIRLYYAVSPTAVKWFGDCEWFRNFFRDKLDSMVFNLQEDGFASTPYQDRDW